MLGRAGVVLCTAAIAATACDGRHAGIGTDEHEFDIIAASRLVVGERLTFSLSDRCAAYDDQLCHTDQYTVISVEASGALGVDEGGELKASLTPGAGTLTVTAKAVDADYARTASVSVEVLAPEGVEPRVVCDARAAYDADLVPVDDTVLLTYVLRLDGADHYGELAENPLEAPDLTFVGYEGRYAQYTTPSTPGAIIEVTAGPGSTPLTLELYDPAVVGIETTATIDDIDPRWNRYSWDLVVDVDPRACEWPAVDIAVTTPAICELDTWIIPLAAGTCTIAVALEGSADVQTHDFAVAPLPPEDRAWDGTCAQLDGATCGFLCGDLWQDGCSFDFTGDALDCTTPEAPTCTLTYDPAASLTTECAASTSEPALLTDAATPGCWTP